MTKESIEKMPQNDDIWKNVEESIIFNSDAYLQVNNLSPKEKEDAKEFDKYITKGNVTE